jgi:hypothetical protein
MRKRTWIATTVAFVMVGLAITMMAGTGPTKDGRAGLARLDADHGSMQGRTAATSLYRFQQ